MKKYILIMFALLTISTSCSEPAEKSELDKILEKIENGDGDQTDMDDLLESFKDEEGSFELTDSEAKFKIKFPVINIEETTTEQIINGEEVEIFHYTANMEGLSRSNDHL